MPVIPRVRSLRARLVVTVVLLFAVACLAIGVATTVALDDYLSQRQDRDLGFALEGFAHGPADRPSGGTGQVDPGAPAGSVPADGRRGGFPGPGLGPLSVSAVFVDGRVVYASMAQRNGGSADVAGLVGSALSSVPSDGEVHDLTIGQDGYRARSYTEGATAYLVAQPDSPGTTATQLVIIEAVVLGGAVILAGVAAAVLVRHEMRPLERVAGVAGQVGRLPLDRGEVHLAARVPDPDPNTEVGQVGTALNRMLDNVEGALAARQDSETRLRRFVADASHELRTPLAAIRGYAELSRREREPVPAGTTHALSRISSQAERMSTLVEDLLLLARLDAAGEGGRALDRSEVDLTRLVLDAVGDAHVAGPGHRFVPDLPDEPVTVQGDAHRLAQVVTNLLTNARTHTPDGTTVVIGLRGNGSGAEPHALLTVRDDGPGIPPETLPRVFERFARGTESRTRAGNDTPSTGLGLAIVAAVASAHGGTVSVDSVPGRTAFTVDLPVHPATPAAPARPTGPPGGAAPG